MSKLLWTLCVTAPIIALTAGCDSSDHRTVGQKLDSAVSTAEQTADQVKQNAKQSVADVKAAARDASQASQDGTSQIGQSIADGAITASIKADIAKDPDLSALRVNVDTHDGKVALYGSAPSEDARQRAERIAMAVKGVSVVDNKLAIETAQVKQ
jgi:hyperosmotically inducible protein